MLMSSDPDIVRLGLVLLPKGLSNKKLKKIPLQHDVIIYGNERWVEEVIDENPNIMIFNNLSLDRIAYTNRGWRNYNIKGRLIIIKPNSKYI